MKKGGNNVFSVHPVKSQINYLTLYPQMMCFHVVRMHIINPVTRALKNGNSQGRSIVPCGLQMAIAYQITHVSKYFPVFSAGDWSQVWYHRTHHLLSYCLIGNADYSELWIHKYSTLFGGRNPFFAPFVCIARTFVSYTTNVAHFWKTFVSASIEWTCSSYLSKVSLSILLSYCCNSLVTGIS